MAFQPVPDTAKVAVITTNGFSEYVNTFHFRRSGAWGLTELNQLLQTVATVWANEVMTALSNSVVLPRVEGRGLRAQTDVSAQFVLPSPVEGTRSGDPLPGNVAFVVTHLTGLSGRSYRGRTFFGGLPESATVGDLILPGVANGLRDALGSLRQIADNAGWTMVVVSRWEAKVRRPQALTIDIIGFRYRDRVLDSQRRRLLNRGR